MAKWSATEKSSESVRAKTLRNRDRFLFHRRFSITDGGAFEKIFAQEGNYSAKTLVLRSVRELVNNQGTISPAIGANENAVLQSETLWSRREKANGRLRDL